MGVIAMRSCDHLNGMHNVRSTVVNSWRDIAYEEICLLHIPQIKKLRSMTYSLNKRDRASSQCMTQCMNYRFKIEMQS